MFFYDYLIYSTIDRALNRFEVLDQEVPLSALVDGTRNSASFQKRAGYAKLAYYKFGVKLPFRGEDDTWSYFEPTPQDEDAYDASKPLGASVVDLRSESRSLLAGTVNVVLYTFITFVFGLIWLAVKRQDSQSSIDAEGPVAQLGGNP